MLKNDGKIMRVFVTGGAGTLGVALAERLVSEGHSFFALDNFATGHRGALAMDHPAITCKEGSIVDDVLLGRCFDEFQPTHVIHSAASYKDPTNWRADAETNVLGTINVVRQAERHNVRRFLNFQTALAYGRPTVVPIPIEAPTQPFTSYGISKTAGEAYVRSSAVPSVSLRLANVTGPRLAIGPIPTFYTRLKAAKPCFCTDSVRDFLDQEDFLDLAMLCLSDDAPTGVFNASTGTGHAIKEIFDAAVSHLGVVLDYDVPIVGPEIDDVSAVVLDPRQTEVNFSWSARFDFAQIMERMFAWYDAHGVDAIYSHLKSPVSGD